MVLKVSSKLTPGLGIIKEAIHFTYTLHFLELCLRSRINSVMTISEACGDVWSQANSQELPTFHYFSGGQCFFLIHNLEITQAVFMRAMLLAFIQVEQEVLSYTGRPPPQDGCGTHTSPNPTSRQTSKMYVKGKQNTSCEFPLTLGLPPFYVPKLFGIRILPELFDFLKWFICCLPFAKLRGVYSQILYESECLVDWTNTFSCSCMCVPCD